MLQINHKLVTKAKVLRANEFKLCKQRWYLKIVFGMLCKQMIYLFTRSSTSHSMDNFEEMNEPPSLPHGGKSRLSSHSDDSGCDLMDDSLTDMQWLPGMDAGGETDTQTCTP